MISMNRVLASVGILIFAVSCSSSSSDSATATSLLLAQQAAQAARDASPSCTVVLTDVDSVALLTRVTTVGGDPTPILFTDSKAFTSSTTTASVAAVSVALAANQKVTFESKTTTLNLNDLVANASPAIDIVANNSNAADLIFLKAADKSECPINLAQDSIYTNLTKSTNLNTVVFTNSGSSDIVVTFLLEHTEDPNMTALIN